MSEQETIEASLDLIICATCGVQYSETKRTACPICDDPRQYVPATGQAWTTLRSLRESGKYHNEFVADPKHPGLISIYTVPTMAIGQRAFLCGTSKGNILWDCITYIDDDTVRRIRERGGLRAIVISHPHYYSTSVVWAQIFDCPLYLSGEDQEWVMRKDGRLRLWEGQRLNLLSDDDSGSGSDIVAVKTGGHFPGSSVLWWESAKKLLVADSIMIVRSGVYHVDRPPNTISFTFMWSYPNMIPLPPNEVHNIWKSIKDLDFDDAHSAFNGGDTKGDSKRRVLESAKIYIRAMGYLDHAIFDEQDN